MGVARTGGRRADIARGARPRVVPPEPETGLPHGKIRFRRQGIGRLRAGRRRTIQRTSRAANDDRTISLRGTESRPGIPLQRAHLSARRLRRGVRCHHGPPTHVLSRSADRCRNLPHPRLHHLSSTAAEVVQTPGRKMRAGAARGADQRPHPQLRTQSRPAQFAALSGLQDMGEHQQPEHLQQAERDPPHIPGTEAGDLRFHEHPRETEGRRPQIAARHKVPGVAGRQGNGHGTPGQHHLLHDRQSAGEPSRQGGIVALRPASDRRPTRGCADGRSGKDDRCLVRARAPVRIMAHALFRLGYLRTAQGAARPLRNRRGKDARSAEPHRPGQERLRQQIGPGHPQDSALPAAGNAVPRSQMRRRLRRCAPYQRAQRSPAAGRLAATCPQGRTSATGGREDPESAGQSRQCATAVSTRFASNSPAS